MKIAEEWTKELDKLASKYAEDSEQEAYARCASFIKQIQLDAWKAGMCYAAACIKDEYREGFLYIKNLAAQKKEL